MGIWPCANGDDLQFRGRHRKTLRRPYGSGTESSTRQTQCSRAPVCRELAFYRALPAVGGGSRSDLWEKDEGSFSRASCHRIAKRSKKFLHVSGIMCQCTKRSLGARS